MSVSAAGPSQEMTQKKAVTSQVTDRYLTMRLGQETYAVDILSVREIIEPVAITRLPNAQAFVNGVINLRGRVISIVDLSMRLGMGKTEFTDQTVIIVLQYEVDGSEESFGILVDEVLEVINLNGENISPPPESSAAAGDRFLVGVGRLDKAVVFVLDLSNALKNTATLQ